MIDQIRLSTISLMKKFILIFFHHIGNYLLQIGLQFSNKNMTQTFLFQIKNLLGLFKGPLPGLRQFLATESPLKMMKNAFYFISRTLFVLRIFKFLSWIFGYAGKRFDKKSRVNFKMYDVYTYYPISREVKTINQGNLVS